MPDEMRLEPLNAYNIAVALTNVAQLIDSSMESDETLTDTQFWALRPHPVRITNMDRQAVSGRLRDDVTVILAQLGDSAPEL